MKIRNGFVSNSSSSSFILIHIPDDFDYDIRMEKIIEQEKEKEDRIRKKSPSYNNSLIKDIKKITKNSIDNFIRRKYLNEEGDDDNFYLMRIFFNDNIVLVAEAPEYAGQIRIINIDEIENKIQSINDKNKEDLSKYSDKVEIRKIKREELSKKMKHIDPFGEEDWDDS